MERLIRNEKAIKMVEAVLATGEVMTVFVEVATEEGNVDLNLVAYDHEENMILDEMVASEYVGDDEAKEEKEVKKAERMAATLTTKIEEVTAGKIQTVEEHEAEELVMTIEETEEVVTETKEDTAEIVYGGREVAIIQDAQNKSEAIRQLYDLDFTVREIFHILNNVGLKTRYQMVYQVIERYEGKLELEGMSEEA